MDTRDWEGFKAGHLPGALHTPLDKSFPTIAGSYVEAHTPIYLVVPEEQVAEAVTDLIRIGLDEVVGFAAPADLDSYASGGGRLEQTRAVNIETFKNELPQRNSWILDVRRADEFDEGHLPGAQNIAHTRLLTRLSEIPMDRRILVHCRTNNRSASAAGLLQKYGYQVVVLEGGIEAWNLAGGEVVKEVIPQA